MTFPNANYSKTQEDLQMESRQQMIDDITTYVNANDHINVDEFLELYGHTDYNLALHIMQAVEKGREAV